MTDMTETTDDKKLTFEEAMANLEQIVSEIEDGKVTLEKSIDRYAEGISLVKQCRAILDQAEQKIQLLSKSESGELSPAGELPDDED